MNNKTHITHG